MPNELLDVVGPWTQIKLRILKDYSRAYAQILGSQDVIKHFAYIDGFAGPGSSISKETKQEIAGSPLIAQSIEPRFSHYHFIDLDGDKVARLQEIFAGREDVSIYHGDCNSILIEQVFPQCRWKDYRRALCVLDPYQLNPNWEVIYTAGHMKSIEIFLNFMIMDASRNILWNNPEKVTAAQKERMNTFWGDESWEKAGYVIQPGLFGDITEKTSNKDIIDAYRKRLVEVAGFKYVPEPIPMKNEQGLVLYYLFFASNNSTGAKIARAIFKKFRT
jgi:three-Cys-motif partner protein